MKRLLMLIFVLAACVPSTQTEPGYPPPTNTAVPPATDIADLLQNRPAPGETVEIDAYFSGADPFSMRGGPPRIPQDRVICPFFINRTLTDQSFLPGLRLLNGAMSNVLPDDVPWLIAAAPEAIENLGQDIAPELPYHVRLLGHLDDPAFAHCQHVDRIFVVEEVITIYEEKPPDPTGWPQKPADFAKWPRYDDPELGFNLAYPPDWSLESLAESDVLGGVVLRPLHKPNCPVTIRVHEGETHFDQYDPASVPPLLQGVGMGVFEQGGSLGDWPDSQHLPGFTVDREAGSGERAEAVLFSSDGRTYEIALTFPTGFDASQKLLTQFTALVESFRLDVLPAPSPTPPINQALGEGPFISREEAEMAVHRQSGSEGDIEILDAQLMSEADARHRADACATFTGHPDGVWAITVRGQFDGLTRVVEQFLDAVTGENLCGEEIAPTPDPNITATPLPPGWPTPAPTPTAAASP